MIILGLGSNFGDRISYLRNAVRALQSSTYSNSIEVISISPIYESDALLPENAPDSWNQSYLNLNLLCKTQLSPLHLLKTIKTLEEKMGRVPRGRWAPREIDIDILAYDDLYLDTESLKIPHPHLLSRPFALLPLMDLIPHWKFPDRSPLTHLDLQSLTSEWMTKSIEGVPFRTRRSTQYFTEWVGILNITPDSFSDGGLYFNLQDAEKKLNEFIDHQISVLDIGAESTRPNATPLSTKEEWNRLAPVLEVLGNRQRSTHAPLTISIDTRNAEVAQKALQAGAHWINDVTGFENDFMKKVAAESDAKLVMMHSLSIPPHSGAVLKNDPISTLLNWGENRIRELESYGISRDRIIFDPGLGFGKTIEQTWEILRRATKFRELGVQILIGHSRKSFLTSLTKLPASNRDIETLAISMSLVEKGIDFVRIHHSEMHHRALKAWTQVNGVIRCHD